MKLKPILIGLLFVVLTSVIFFIIPWSQAIGRSLYEEFEPFTQAFSLIQNNYVESAKVETKKLVYGAIKGMMGTLDPFSQFMDSEAYKGMMTDTKGSFGGLGIEIVIRENQLMVMSPIEGTPADRAGIKAGDKIMKINGEATEKLSLTDAVSKMRGVPGTEVTLSLYRADVFDLKDFKIIRAVIKIHSVKPGILLSDGIGYVRLSQFMETSADDLKKSLDDLKNQGMKKIIFDLRNNPGGLLDMSVKIASFFLPESTLVVYTEGRLPNQNRKFYAGGYSEYRDFPMVVLVNQGSASAAEIVSGAMQDLKRGLLIGEKTFGKASVQTIQPLSDGSALRLTTAHYFTPKGRLIHEKGIEPDIKMEEMVKPAEETKKAFEKDVFYSFAHEWIVQLKKKGKEMEGTVLGEEMKKEFLKFCLSKKTPISVVNYEADKELIEREIMRSLVDQARGADAAKVYVLSHDKTVLKAVEELKKQKSR